HTLSVRVLPTHHALAPLPFFSPPPAPPQIYTLSLHDALPIFGVALARQELERHTDARQRRAQLVRDVGQELLLPAHEPLDPVGQDRKSTRLNSSHVSISYAVFCLKKKKKKMAGHALCAVNDTHATTSTPKTLAASESLPSRPYSGTHRNRQPPHTLVIYPRLPLPA